MGRRKNKPSDNHKPQNLEWNDMNWLLKIETNLAILLKMMFTYIFNKTFLPNETVYQ